MIKNMNNKKMMMILNNNQKLIINKIHKIINYNLNNFLASQEGIRN